MLYDVVIIGGGIVGCAIARELMHYRLRAVLLEKEIEVDFGTSKANSGIIHSGCHTSPATLKGRLEWAGNQMWARLCAELGFGFKRGKEYAEQEHTDPRRIVTTTVGVENGLWARLPVKTNQPVPKAMVRAICQALRGLTVHAPVKLGQVILSNVLDSGADIVATRDMPESHL